MVSEAEVGRDVSPRLAWAVGGDPVSENTKEVAGEMAQWLKAHIALASDLNLVLSTQASGSQLSLNPGI